MFIRIETTSGVPITRQIMDQIRAQCVSGALSPGARLYSVRALAKELAVNQNTILRVYERLTAEGLLERRHGDGTYVADNLAKPTAEASIELIRGDIDRLVQRALALGLAPSIVVKKVEQAFARMPQPSETERKSR